VSENQEKKSGWRWGVNRWIVLALIIASAYAASLYPPVQPHVQLPAENISHNPLFTIPGIGEIYFTNTILFATITLLVLVVNWMELLPGVDSIGILHHDEHGYEVQDLGWAATIVKTPEGEHGEEAAHGEEADLYGLIPYIRVTSTDLNFTVALALIAVFMVQVIGFRAQGLSYLTKFFNTKTFFSVPIFGVIDFVVGLLELVSEFSKILSFAFRLFGNIFAGSVLLFVMGALLGQGGFGFFQVGFLLLEFFVGLIQAIVFGMLTMTFMAQATQGHGEHEEAHA
jgi:F-type H+-transporting ATPase subunit a